MTVFRRRNDLDDLLGSFSKLDPISMRMLLQNLLICGKSGSGKTTGAGDYFLRCFVRYLNSGGIILASKPEDRAYITRVFKEEGRLRDLRIIEPGGRYRFNLLDYEMKRNADTRQLSQLLLLLGETLDRSGGGRDGDSFFKAKAREGLDHAIEIVTRAQGELDPWGLQCFISGAAMSLEEVNDEAWKASFHHQALLRAAHNCATDIQRHDCQAATQHWTSTWPRLNDRTRTSIEASMLSPLHVFNTGIVRDLLATSTNITPAMTEERLWILVNMPIVPGDATATFVNAAVKLAFQRYVLSRKAGAGDPVLCLWSDEFQTVASSFDRAYIEACRSHRGCLVALSQSLHAIYAHLYGPGGEHETDALITNFGHVICHTLGDAKTAKYFSSLLGMRRELFITPSIQPNHSDMYEAVIWGKSPVSVSCSESYQPVLQPAAFLSGLRSGGPPDNTVDAIVIRSGQPFHQSGENYLRTSFKQR